MSVYETRAKYVLTVFVGQVEGMGRKHANKVLHIAVTPASGGANMLLP